MQRAAGPSRLRPRSVWMLLTVVVVVGMGIATWTVNRSLLRPTAVAPYSIQDRRMTFAVLPFQAPAEDKGATQVAAAMTETVSAVEEGKVLWAQVASRRSVEQALAQHAAPKDAASALDVHFLIRGNVTPTPSGYNVELLVVDAATERVIGTKSVAAAAGALAPRRREDLEGALGSLTYRALQAEVQRARSKPVEALDVRDLSFRAYVDWGDRKEQRDEKGAYVAATDLLNRALAISPDDRLALWLTARVNLCDCVDGWSKNVAEQQTIGAAALDKYLRYNPESSNMLNLKSELFALRGRYEESMLITESVLKREPENVGAIFDKSYALLKLGRPQEALAVIKPVLESDERTEAASTVALAAALHYQLGQYEAAAQLARKATTQMDRELLRNPKHGAASLTLIAAEARLGHLAQAKTAMADFNAAVPGVQSISAVKKWMHHAADLAGYEPLFEGLRLAGIGD